MNLWALIREVGMMRMMPRGVEVVVVVGTSRGIQGQGWDLEQGRDHVA